MTDTTFDPDNGLFPAAFATVRATWQPFLTATVLILATDVAQAFLPAVLPFAVTRTLILIIAGYAAYRALLSRGLVAGWTAAATETGHVPWRYAGVMLIILAPMLMLGVIWTAPGGIAASGAGMQGGGPHNMRLAELAIGPVLMVSYTVIYVLLGTALPETVERGNAALGRTLRRGRKNYRKIALSLMFGPWLFRASMVVVLLLVSYAGIKVHFVDARTGLLQPLALIPMMIFASGHVFAEVLTAVVLVRVYRRF